MAGMRVVEMDRRLLGQRGQRAEFAEMALQDVLQRGGGEEILLAQAQFLTGLAGIGGIEHARQRIGLVALAQRADVVAGVEGVEQDRIERQARPEPQRVDPLAAPADHRRVVGDGENAVLRLPDVALEAPGLVGDRFDRAAEADLEGPLAALELPGIAVLEPGLRQFDLPAVMDLLAEHAVDVADAVAVRRHLDGRHALHEAGGEPAETAIAERRVGLEFGDQVDVDAERGQRLAHALHQAEIGEGVAHQAADQEFEREVIDALGAALVGSAWSSRSTRR